MMKSIRSRLTVTFIGLIAVILAVIWGVNKWYLEDFYVTKKVQALNGAYEAIEIGRASCRERVFVPV